MADLESRLEDPAGREKAAAYLEFEDFSHTGLGLETYEDGLQHPIELRRILTGDLRWLLTQAHLLSVWFLSSHFCSRMRLTDHFSLEMSVSFQARADDVFQTLDYPSKKKKGVGWLMIVSLLFLCNPKTPPWIYWPRPANKSNIIKWFPQGVEIIDSHGRSVYSSFSMPQVDWSNIIKLSCQTKIIMYNMGKRLKRRRRKKEKI